jgi:hypothetical protein
MVSTSRYLTGDKEGIKAFVDKFDVGASHTPHPRIFHLEVLFPGLPLTNSLQASDFGAYSSPFAIPTTIG